jgi:hypothetical protein
MNAEFKAEYIARQVAMAESPAGKLAITMRPGTRWLRPNGDTVCVWMSWTPDVKGESADAAAKYKWGMSLDHNSEIGIGVEGSSCGIERVKVTDVGDWARLEDAQKHPCVR